MKTLLEIKAIRLEEQTRCPCCHSARQHFVKSEEHFPGETVSGGYTMNPDDKTAAAFVCGSEFSIDKRDDIICRKPCSQPSHEAALELQKDAEDLYADQEIAA